MSVFVFFLLILLLLLAAYVVIQTINARRPPSELVRRIKPISSETRRVLSRCRFEPCTPTWIQVADMIRIQRNSTIMTRLIERYHRVMGQCTDRDDLADMHLTYETALREREILFKQMFQVVVEFCFGRIAWKMRNPYMAQVATHYTNQVLLVGEMLELMDGSAVSLMEGQFFHGS